jgi:EF-hand domain pair
MRRLTFAMGLIVGAALLAQSVMAQRGGRGGPPGGAGGALPIIAALDTDGDGELSAKEIDNAAAALRTLDKNRDGKLTREEFLGTARGGGPGGPNTAELVARMMAFDKNGDGKLSKDELPERMQGLLARADANKDGFVDKDELTKLAQQQAGRNQGFGPGGGRGGFSPREGGRGSDEGRGRDRTDEPRS